MYKDAPLNRSIRIVQRLLIAAVLLASLFVFCSYARRLPIVGDETLGYYTINQPTLRAMLHFQLTTPLVLEPPTFEILAHFSEALLGLTAMSIRLPSILSFVLLQFFLFATLRKIAGFRPALVAAVLPLVLNITVFAPVARPYAFLLATSMGAFFCWQYASHHSRFRVLALCGLAVSVGLAITSQFYGALIVLPLMAGELLRSVSARRWRISTWIALFAGACTVLLDVPFRNAAAAYKENVPRDTGLGFHTIAGTYFSLLLRSDRVYRAGRETLLSFVMAAVLSYLLYRSYRYVRHTAGLSAYLPEWLAFSVLALLPLLIVPIAYWVVGTYQSRHCVICVPGFIALLVLSIAGGLARITERQWWTILVLAGCLGPVLFVRQLRHMSAHEADFLTSLQTQGSMLTSREKNPGKPIYVAALQCVDFAQNLPPELLSHFRCLYSDHSLRYIYLTEEALMQHTTFPIRFASYEEFKGDLPAYLVYTPFVKEEWIPTMLKIDGAKMESLGPGLDGTIYSVSIPGK